MKAVILAGGKGTRLLPLTEKTPKPLIKVGKKPLIEYALSSLPNEVTEVIIIVKYKGEQIKKYCGSKFNPLKISFVEQREDMPGTAGALWSAKNFLESDAFLVLNSDDIYTKDDILKLSKENLAFGTYWRKPFKDNPFHSIEEKRGCFKGIKKPSETQLKEGFLVATGAYKLDYHIFKLKPTPRANGEYGLPWMVLDMAKKHPVKLVKMDFWLPVNSLADLKTARSFFSS